ncbi:MAG: 50S ribosomal protein L28 [Alphaproteobacteria bacterium]|nr:50S ribosomal protein L28 [Alphaproteobacteria bacterium]NCB49952.1 50S ribosomal protein L28 [Alphaproteobacteria bacterium]
MARRCPITGKGVLTGNTVSHAHNKNRRRFLPNLQNVSLLSEALGSTVKMKISVPGLRTIEHNGGLDSYLFSKKDSRLTKEALVIKRRIQKVLKKDAAKAEA